MKIKKLKFVQRIKIYLPLHTKQPVEQLRRTSYWDCLCVFWGFKTQTVYFSDILQSIYIIFLLLYLDDCDVSLFIFSVIDDVIHIVCFRFCYTLPDKRSYLIIDACCFFFSNQFFKSNHRKKCVCAFFHITQHYSQKM